jgi:hypothetical protein
MTPDQQTELEKRAVRDHFEALGFKFEHLGGNLTGFVRRYDDGSFHVVNSVDYQSAPETLEDVCGFTLFDAEHQPVGDDDVEMSAQELLDLFRNEDAVRLGIAKALGLDVPQETP